MQNDLSKKELKKLKKKEEVKLKKQIEKGDTEKICQSDEDLSSGRYGVREMHPNELENKRVILPVNNINETVLNQTVSIIGHLHQVRKTGKQAFVVVREKMSTVQCIAYMDEQTISRQMLQFIATIPKESFIEVEGIVTAVTKPVESCTQSSVELQLTRLFLISKAQTRLPLQLEDAMRSETDGLARVNLDTRLDNRVLELRTPTNHAIFRIQSEVRYSFSHHLRARGFTCISPPSMISAASEGGANVFEVKYFQEKAYLAQSPQLYKQMAIVSGFERVYAVTPVFRAENSNTHRHLTEFWGLDLEMVIRQHYHEALDLICETLLAIFRDIEAMTSELATVRRQFPVAPFEYLEPTLVLTFAEGVAMLRQAGVEVGDYDDLSTTNEKLLGRLVKHKFGTDFYVLDRFPTAVRPFYTMPDPTDAAYSNSYDVFMRGEEIMSGAQRIHDAAMLRESAVRYGINVDTIKDYLESFENACPPHAGGGIGLERVVMLYLGLDNIRRASMFPRDPKRLRP